MVIFCKKILQDTTEENINDYKREEKTNNKQQK